MNCSTPPPPAPPTFPVELIELFIATTWHSFLSSRDRIKFMTTSSLTCKAWRELFRRISLTDVYLPSPSYAKKYFRTIEGEDAWKHEVERSWVKSITVTLDYAPLTHRTGRFYQPPKMTYSASSLLHLLDRGGRDQFPNLRRLCIGHMNPPFDADIFDLLIWNPFPTIISELELDYMYSPESPEGLIEKSRANYGNWHKSLSKQFGSISRLVIIGAPSGLVVDFASACPNVENIVMEVWVPPQMETKLYCVALQGRLVDVVAGITESNRGSWGVALVTHP